MVKKKEGYLMSNDILNHFRVCDGINNGVDGFDSGGFMVKSTLERHSKLSFELWGLSNKEAFLMIETEHD